MRLKGLGLADTAIEAVWPSWWSAEADSSTSARTELRFGVARRLGLDPSSLFGDEAPRFLWTAEARFKHLSTEGNLERAGITSFGRAVAAALIGALPPSAADLSGASAHDLRQSIIDSGRPYVGLADLLALCWGIGIPVAHLRVFPWPQKRMAAMTVGLEDRWSILLGKDAGYPAWISFYLAHELGHIALSHVGAGGALVDLDFEDPGSPGDEEEDAADAFALELLTGQTQPTVLLADPAVRATASELARIAVGVAAALQIEPGTLALCFGYSTQDWKTANGSLKVIYTETPVWQEVNRVAMTQLHLGELSTEAVEFLATVLGQPIA